ncbi:MAG: hypothetical protein ACLT1X_06905, partial [Christensenellales bacterium]
KAPRAVRGSFSASFDGMILAHFCSVCIRVFRQGSDDCASLLGSTLLSRYLLHCSADSSTCYCQAHTQLFQLLPNRKLNLFSMVFFITHTFPFFASLCARFFLSNGTKKAPRAVRGSFSASFDGMILAHFCSVCIRVFRQGSDDCASLLGSTLLSRYLLHCCADSFTCYCQAHTQVFQLLPNRRLNLFSMIFFVTHTVPFFASLSRTFFSIGRYEKAPRAVRGSSSVSFDGMILSHFCSVCIRIFRHGLSFFSIRHEFM